MKNVLASETTFAVKPRDNGTEEQARVRILATLHTAVRGNP
jgi:hypothetical protein